MQIQVQEREYIFEQPCPIQSCHASTLIRLPNGDVLAAWFGGTREGNPDVTIWGSRRSQGLWSAPVKISDAGGQPHWNPVLFLAPDGRTWLFYKVGQRTATWHTRVMVSADGGLTWTASRPLVAGDVGGRGPVKNKPIVLSNDHWLAPASIEGDEWNAFVDESPDQGITWKQSALIPLQRQAGSEPSHPGAVTGKGVIQPTLWESPAGQVHMLLRSTETRIFRSDSTDGGRSWCQAYPTALPNNNSGIDLVKMDSGLLGLVFNPLGVNWGPRTPLIVSTSDDNGSTWRQGIVLEDGPGEYSYPSVITYQNELWVTYTWKRQRIVFVRLSLT